MLDDGVLLVEKSGLSEREHFGSYLCKRYVNRMNARGVLGRGSAKGKKESAGGGLICRCKGKGRCDEYGRKRKRQTSDTAWYALRVFGV